MSCAPVTASDPVMTPMKSFLQQHATAESPGAAVGAPRMMQCFHAYVGQRIDATKMPPADLSAYVECVLNAKHLRAPKTEGLVRFPLYTY